MGRDLLPLPDTLAAAGPQGLQLKAKLQSPHPDSPLSGALYTDIFFIIITRSHYAAHTNLGGEMPSFQVRWVNVL